MLRLHFLRSRNSTEVTYFLQELFIYPFSNNPNGFNSSVRRWNDFIQKRRVVSIISFVFYTAQVYGVLYSGLCIT